MSVLRVENLQAKFGSFTLGPISFNLDANKIFVILGKNGAGKTKLLECICGLEDCFQGRIILNDLDITHLKPQIRKIGFISNNLSLFPHMSVMDNLKYALKFNDQKIDIQKIIDVFEIRRFLNKKPSQLSGGQKQKVALARVFCASPTIILFDEPTSNISFLEKPDLLKKIRSILKQFRYGTIFVTHDISEAIYMADEIALIENGRFESLQAKYQFLFEPQDLSSAIFLNYNQLEGEVVENSNSCKIKVKDQLIYAKSNFPIGKAACFISPDVILLSKNKTKLRNSLFCTVEEIYYNGFVFNIILNCGFKLKAYITKYHVDELSLKIGDTVYANFQEKNVIVLSIV